MKLTIKVLKGQDLELEVTGDEKVADIKKQIERELSIPIACQKLLLSGRTLTDVLPISSYNIKDSSKLNLVVMKMDGIKEQINRSFRKYFNQTQAQLLTKEFMDDFEKTLQNMSLDDIEQFSNFECNRTEK